MLDDTDFLNARLDAEYEAMLDDPAYAAWCDQQQLDLIRRSLPVGSKRTKIAKSRLSKLRVKAANAERRKQIGQQREQRTTTEQTLLAALAS